MTTQNIPELLASVLSRYLHVEVISDASMETLRREIDHPKEPGRATMFRHQLAEAISNRTLTPAQYEQMTDEELESDEEVAERLRELWHDLYGDEPVTLSNAA